MKFITLKSLLVVLVFAGFANSGISQNYRNICSPGTTFFKDNDNNLEAFRMDSVYPLTGQDTIFISFRTILPPYYINMCFDTTNGSILGRKVYEKSDGTFYFFNYSQDTVTIKTQTTLNGTWKFFSLLNNAKIEAKVISIGPDSVPGGTDMVKTISLQAKNSSGGNIPYYLNQKTIKLSQHYGLSKILDLYSINDTIDNDTISYSLAGKTSPVMGMQPFTWSDVYDFQVGDLFHYQGFEHYNNAGTEWKLIQQVLAKTISANSDTIRYQIENCELKQFPVPPPNTQKIFDTITVTYILSASDSGLYRLPMEFHRIYLDNHVLANYYNRRINYNGRSEQYFCNNNYEDYGSCWAYSPEAGGETDYYSPGLGQTAYIIIWFELDGMYDWEKHLVYFEKGNETWGTPLSEDCSTLLGSEQLSNSDDRQIMIIPNPVDQSALITLPEISKGVQGYFVLYNELGNQVMKVPFNSPRVTFTRNNLPSGIYYIVISGDNGTLKRSAKVILR
jgi:hypothetical protein